MKQDSMVFIQAIIYQKNVKFRVHVANFDQIYGIEIY